MELSSANSRCAWKIRFDVSAIGGLRTGIRRGATNHRYKIATNAANPTNGRKSNMAKRSIPISAATATTSRLVDVPIVVPIPPIRVANPIGSSTPEVGLLLRAAAPINIGSISTTIGDNTVLVMANHGVMAVGETLAEAFDELYYFERACRTLITAYSTGRPLRIAPHDVAALTAQQWLDYKDGPSNHFREIKAILDAEEPDYRT